MMSPRILVASVARKYSRVLIGLPHSFKTHLKMNFTLIPNLALFSFGMLNIFFVIFVLTA